MAQLLKEEQDHNLIGLPTSSDSASVMPSHVFLQDPVARRILMQPLPFFRLIFTQAALIVLQILCLFNVAHEHSINAAEST